MKRKDFLKIIATGSVITAVAPHTLIAKDSPTKPDKAEYYYWHRQELGKDASGINRVKLEVIKVSVNDDQDLESLLDFHEAQEGFEHWVGEMKDDNLLMRNNRIKMERTAYWVNKHQHAVPNGPSGTLS